MAGPQFPSIQGLAQMEFLPAFAFQQARDQSALANQFAQQEMAQGQQDLEAKQLANVFNAQNNPLKVQSTRLSNLGQEQTNLAKQMENEDYQAVRKEKVAQSRAEALQKASTAELIALQAKAQLAMASGDPEAIKKGTKVFDASFEEMNRRRQAEDKLKLEREKSAADFARTKYVQDRQDSREDRRISAATARAEAKAKGVGNVYDAVKTGKVSPEKAAAAFYAQAMAPDTDPAEVQALLGHARQMEQVAQTMKAAGNPNRPDMNAMGIPTQAIQPTIPQQAPMPQRVAPQAGGQPAPQAPAAPAKLKAPPTQADLEATARKYGVTVDEVKRRLGL